MAGPLWQVALDPLIYSSSGNYRQYAAAPGLPRALEAVETRLYLSGMVYGAGLLLAGLVAFASTYLAPRTNRTHMLLLGLAIGASVGVFMLVPGVIIRERLLFVLHWPLISVAHSLGGGSNQAYVCALIPLILSVWSLLGLCSGWLLWQIMTRKRC
jgi:hypothetical protein